MPEGDLAVPSLVPDVVEVVALDAGPSVRYVSKRLAARWGVSQADLIAAAEEQIRKFRMEHADRGSIGRPNVRAIFCGEPHSGVYARHIGHFAPDSIGLMGTLLAIPSRDGVFYRALDPAPDLRGDLVEVALLATRAHRAAEMPVLVLPIWRRPDGRCRVVRFEFSPSADLIGSWDPAFQGVLTVLAPLTTLPVPTWAEAMDPAEYTLFAGLVSASAAVWPEEVAILDEPLALVSLLERCRSIVDDRWPDTVDDHILDLGQVKIADALIRDAAGALDRVAGRLVAQLVAMDASLVDACQRPTSLPGAVEIISLTVEDEVTPVPAQTAQAMGPKDDLFARAERQGGQAVSVRTLGGSLSPGVYQVIGNAASLALLHLAEWSPDVVGAGGLMVGSGRPEGAYAVRVDDVLAVLEITGLIGLVAGDVARRVRAIPPTIVWDRDDLRAVIHLDVDESGALLGSRVGGPLERMAAQVPMVATAPFGLGDILGEKRWRPFLGALRDEVIARLMNGATQLIDLHPPNIREFAAACRSIPERDWPRYLSARFDDIAVRRARLDALSLRSTYDEARRHLTVRVGEGLGMVLRHLPGGTTIYLCLANDGRYRPLLKRTVERWGVEEERCWEDAITNLLADHVFVEEPIAGGHPSWRALFVEDGEYEAAAVFLDRMHPGTRHGFVVSVTHGSRAHFVQLDDPGAARSVVAFASYIATLYRNARDAGDAHSSVLLWLRPDGRLEELFNTLEPIPSLDRLPADFATLVRSPS